MHKRIKLRRTEADGATTLPSPLVGRSRAELINQDRSGERSDGGVRSMIAFESLLNQPWGIRPWHSNEVNPPRKVVELRFGD